MIDHLQFFLFQFNLMNMSAYRTIALTIAFAVIVNAHIVVAHPASMFSSEMLKNMESDPPIDKMVISFRFSSLIRFHFKLTHFISDKRRLSRAFAICW